MKNNKFDVDSDTRYNFAQNVHKDLSVIAGILTGIAADGIINSTEIEKVTTWFHSLGNKLVRHPYSEVAELLNYAVANDDFTVETARDVIWLCDKYLRTHAFYGTETTDRQGLLGMLTGIAIDNKITDDEIRFLDGWLEENEHLTTVWPYDELYSIVNKVLADGIITADEKHEMLTFCKTVGAVGTDNSAFSKKLTSYLHIDPTIIIPDHSFCITGISKKYKRRQLQEMITACGGIVKDQITQSLHYLIVCNNKNTQWAYTCYGRKIEEVLYNRQQGAKTILAHEFDLMDALSHYNIAE